MRKTTDIGRIMLSLSRPSTNSATGRDRDVAVAAGVDDHLCQRRPARPDLFSTTTPFTTPASTIVSTVQV